ncbi:hypothetical protein OPV22_009208 [Ensete ventricosum]|uniref:CRIB domain-containing protein n=1 Tax=Ensete ventricosum TaxID=4639 RepID=A0AAV8RHY3_ENSVE|nr:hypothetical protein OPV22_009208 [Ensete ventricosum]
MGTKMKGLLKGLRYISQIFDGKDQEMQIGHPTDVKHVAHVGCDGSSNHSPSWMNEFRSESDPHDGDDADATDADATAAAPPQVKHHIPEPHQGGGSSADASATPLPHPSRRVDTMNNDDSSSDRHSRRHQSSGAVSGDHPRLRDTSEESKHGRKHRSSAGIVGAEQTAPDLPAVPKQPRRRKAKGSSSAAAFGYKLAITTLVYLGTLSRSVRSHRHRHNIAARSCRPPRCISSSTSMRMATRSTPRRKNRRWGWQHNLLIQLVSLQMTRLEIVPVPVSPSPHRKHTQKALRSGSSPPSLPPISLSISLLFLCDSKNPVGSVLLWEISVRAWLGWIGAVPSQIPGRKRWSCFLVLYYGPFFGPRGQHANSALEYGSRISRSIGWSNGDNGEVGKSEESIFGQEDGEDGLIPKSFPVCDDRHSELIPCLDRNLIYQTRLKLDLSLMEHYERHCPQPERRYNCLIPPPAGYKVPIKWPKSRDEVWQVNIPHTHLAHEKSDQNWMVVKGDKIVFPGGGTHFHYGADKYIAHLANMLNFTNNNLNNEGRIRTVFDVGCGVASFGGYLLSSDIIAMSLAPNDVHQNQIQFALERGIPAYLGVLGTKRLPYPSRSFEFAHCSRCRIDWLQRDGILLLELDRLLRPGGYFAYSSPEAYAQDEEDLKIWKEMSALVERMCWKIAAKKNQTVIWVKPLTNDCYLNREPGTRPPLCRSDNDPDAVWGVPMEACITPYTEQNQRDRGSGLAPWPSRLTTPPPRLADFGISADMFEKDMEIWRQRVENYWSLLNAKIRPNTLRNLMDMKANMGSFAAALKDEPVWVMNVEPEDGPNLLKIIYDRGLMGTVHDWCEATVLFGNWLGQRQVLAEKKLLTFFFLGTK